VLLIKNIVSELPAQKFYIGAVTPNLKLADPYFNIPKGIDILLGIELFYETLLGGTSTLNNGQIRLQNTAFGWVANGPMVRKKSPVFCGTIIKKEESLDSQLKKFWEIEEFKTPTPIFTKEELKCEELFSKTTHKNEDGKFVVKRIFPIDLSKFSPPQIRSFHTMCI